MDSINSEHIRRAVDYRNKAEQLRGVAQTLTGAQTRTLSWKWLRTTSIWHRSLERMADQEPKL